MWISCKFTYTPSLLSLHLTALSHPPLQVFTEHWAELPGLYSSSPLALSVTHGSAYVSTLLPQFTPPSPCPPWAHLSVLRVCVHYFLNCLVLLGQVSYHFLNVWYWSWWPEPTDDTHFVQILTLLICVKKKGWSLSSSLPQNRNFCLSFCSPPHRKAG